MNKDDNEISKAATNGRADRPKPNAPWYVKAFVVFHILAITIFAIPNPPAGYQNGTMKLGIDSNAPGGVIGSFSRLLVDGLSVWKLNYGRQSILGYYPLSTGFWQYWDMFAPNPVDYDLYATADVVYKDGSSITYKYPRMYELDLLNKYVAERYRKFFERVNVMQPLWAPFAKRIALVSTKSLNNPVVGVTLWRHQLNLPPPDKPIPTKYFDYDFFNAEMKDDGWHYYVHQSDGWHEAFIR